MYVRVDAYAYVYAYAERDMIFKQAQTYVHTYMHTYIHSYTHTYMHLTKNTDMRTY